MANAAGQQTLDKLTVPEEKALAEFLSTAAENDRALPEWILERGEALKFLMARKFDVERAIQLVRNHMTLRNHYGLDIIDPDQDPVRSELASGKLTVLDARDPFGAQLILIRMNQHQPGSVQHITFVKALSIQLDAMLESTETCRNGVVLLIDMSESKYANFDRKLGSVLVKLLQEGYPARLKKLYVINAPWWFRSALAIVRLFMKQKIRERIAPVSQSQLLTLLPRQSLPSHLGGDLTLDHYRWLERCAAHCKEQRRRRQRGVRRAESFSLPVKKEKEGEEGENDVPPPAPVRSSSMGKSLRPAKPPRRQHGVVPDGDDSEPIRGFEDDVPPPLPPKELDVYTDEDRLMSVEELRAFVEERGGRGLREDYALIKAERDAGNFSSANHPANVRKNRYTDVLCVEHSRVRLSVIGGDESTDYINANYVDGYNQEKKYIFTQGPLPHTYADFWRMVWEGNVVVVVMLTKLFERGRLKSGKYWPDVNEKDQFGDFVVAVKSEKPKNGFTLREIEISKGPIERRRIFHFQFTDWPDYGVPTSAQSLFELMQDVNAHQEEAREAVTPPPIVIHCSAGIGRTGSYGAIDISLRQLKVTGKVNVEGVVRKIRSQRSLAIQTAEQYEFVHRTILEHAAAAGCGVTN